MYSYDRRVTAKVRDDVEVVAKLLKPMLDQKAIFVAFKGKKSFTPEEENLLKEAFSLAHDAYINALPQAFAMTKKFIPYSFRNNKKALEKAQQYMNFGSKKLQRWGPDNLGMKMPDKLHLRVEAELERCLIFEKFLEAAEDVALDLSRFETKPYS